MQAAAAALTLLSVFFSLDCSSAQRLKQNQIQNQEQNDRNAQSDAKKGAKNQPHILFILTDDQVGEPEKRELYFWG